MLKPFIIHSALISDMGLIRRHNEDAHYCNGSFCALEDMDRHVEHYEELTADKALFAICDGMGGQQHGEKAAYTAVRQMKELHQQLPGRDFHIVLQHWIRQTTTLVREASDGGGCTLALLYVEDHMLRVCHVGDSRIYRFHHSQLTRLTLDHSQVEMMLSAGMITPEEARTHPRRHAITRYLGMPSHISCEATFSQAIPLMDGDIYLLCSDGLTDMLSDADISAILRQESALAARAQALFQAAMKAGGRDNITLTLLQISGEDDDLLPMAPDEEDEPTVDFGPDEPLSQTIVVQVQQSAAKTTDITMSIPAQHDATLRITTTIHQPR